MSGAGGGGPGGGGCSRGGLGCGGGGLGLGGGGLGLGGAGGRGDLVTVSLRVGRSEMDAGDTAIRYHV